MNQDEFRQKIITQARRFLGTPYHHQASCVGVGCDCLGLVRGVWRALYGKEPEDPGAYGPCWAVSSSDEHLRDAALRHLHAIDIQSFGAGDVLLFRWRRDFAARHLGIATSETTMVHAHEGASVCEVSIGLWRSKLAYAFRFP